MFDFRQSEAGRLSPPDRRIYIARAFYVRPLPASTPRRSLFSPDDATRIRRRFFLKPFPRARV
jgi:hypothetical protein